VTSDINIKCINEIVHALVDVVWFFAWVPQKGLRSLLLSKLGDLEREEFMHFLAEELSALDLVQKIKEEARTWGLAGAKFLTALIVAALIVLVCIFWPL
jgi:hypothetical protein